MPDVTFTVDGKQLTAPAGTLLIDACRTSGIEIPAFCYYPGLSLQAACRMCVVRIDKIPKMQTACTTPVAEGMAVHTETEEVTQSRKAMLELLLGNHPLDCPVCDAGGECELQDMTFKYGAPESKFVEIKQHREEQQWSPVVYFDRPRCILCYRCVRMCGEGMDVWALGVQNRGASSVIAPNKQDHLECEECGMCIDVCPVGALTSGPYRYKTRPWEMNHTATVCTHCGDGCQTTLGTRRSDAGMEIVRADNRDKSGMNGDFLCIKGRFAFDFVNREDRLTTPLIRRGETLQPATWEEALQHAAAGLKHVRDQRGGAAIGVIGSNRTTNEENYLLQKFARTVLGTNNIDHHRTADYPAFAQAIAASGAETASVLDFTSAAAMLVIGGNPTEEHPLLAWNIRQNVRINGAKLFIANHKKIKLQRQAKATYNLSEADSYAGLDAILRGEAQNDDARAFGDTVRAEHDAEAGLVVAIAGDVKDGTLAAIIHALPKAKFALLGDYANSRGAADMGLYPDLLPGYVPVGSASVYKQDYPGISTTPGKNIVEILDGATTGDIAALYVVGSNPAARYAASSEALTRPFLIVQDLFLTETALLADVVFPAAASYEKSGTQTNSYGDLQALKQGADRAGVRSDLEIIVRLAAAMGVNVKTLVPYGAPGRADLGQSRGAQSGEADRNQVYLSAHQLEPRTTPFDPNAVMDEIHRLVPGYSDISRLELASGTPQRVGIPAAAASLAVEGRADLVLPSDDTLYSSGTLGRYCATLGAVVDSGTTSQQLKIAADAL